MLLSEKDAKRICDRVLGYIKADDAIVTVSSEDYAHLRFAANSFTTNGRRENVTVQLTVWIDRKRGSASVNQTDDTSLKEAARQAEQMARLSPVDIEYLPTLGPQVYKPVNGYVAATANISLSDRAKVINETLNLCEAAKVVGAGFHQASGSATAFATRHGNFDYQRSSLVSLSLTARNPDGGSSGYFLRNHFDVSKLDTMRIARESIRKATESSNPKTLAAGLYPVILEPQAAADLLSSIFTAFDARSADEGRSALSGAGGKTKLGEKIFDERINLSSDPWHPELPGSQSAQSGIPAQKIDFVRNGVIENLVYSRYWAKQKGKEPTPGPVNTILQSTARLASVEDMIRSLDRGLLVSRFWYIRMVEPRTMLLTGLTRDGVWYIENGKIQYPVRNFRFNQSIIQMLGPDNVEMIGAAERTGSNEGQGRSAGLFPALKLRQFNFTSQSEAV